MDREDQRAIANEVVWGLLRKVLAILALAAGVWLIYASGIIGAIFALAVYAMTDWYMVLVPVVLTVVIIACGRR